MEKPSHTSTDVVPIHPSCLSEEQLLKDCEVSRGRAGGPGGQHRNKVETAVEILHRPTGVSATATERRSQKENLAMALRRLRLLLAIQFRNVRGQHVEPSRLWQSRCQRQKINCNEQHKDFPALLAEAMNAVWAKDGDVRKAAAALGCSASQLIRFLAKQPEALDRVNERRAQFGLRKLHS